MRRTKSTKPTANKHQTPQQREAHLANVARLYLTGHLQVEIATQTGVSQQQISYDLKVLQKRWRESSGVDFNEAKQRELARIDNLELEYWQAWRASKGEKKKQSAERSGEHTKTRFESEVREGDPRYLQGVQWCIEQRCKILEIGIKTKTEISGELGIKAYVGISPDDWDKSETS
jgi:hypothetical protein